jgi:hypothetical protein
MSDRFFLLIRVGEACLINTVALFMPLRMALPFKIANTDRVQEILVITGVCLGCGVATWWIFRKLQLRYTKREAKAVATAFAVFTPVSLGISVLFAMVPGAYIAQPFDLIFKSTTGIFDMLGTFVSLVVTTTLLGFAVCVFALWMTRHIQKLQQA